MYRQPPPQAGGYRPPPQYQQARQQPQQDEYIPPQQSYGEYVPPQPDGRKAVVAMNIQVLVEVNHTGDYFDMVQQAKEDIARRVVEAKTFLPMRMESDRIYSDVTVAELKTALVVPPNKRWNW